MIGRELCCRCWRKAAEAAARRPCPGCGKPRLLDPSTGQCGWCSRRCLKCGKPVRFKDATLCRDCRRREGAAAKKSPCPRCGRPGILRAATGWCGTCSRPKPAKKPARICIECAQVTRHPVNGLCSACWQRHPDRPFVRGEHLASSLAAPPCWLEDFVVFTADRYCPARAACLIGALGLLLADGESVHPQQLLERARTPGRSMGPLARLLQEYFTATGQCLRTDQDERLAAGRRRRRVEAVPASLRQQVDAYSQYLVSCQGRARRSGTKPRSNSTIESGLGCVRDFAIYLRDVRGKDEWVLANREDLEAFLGSRGAHAPRTLTALKLFFRWARTHKIVLVEPTAGMSLSRPRGITGAMLTQAQQRALYRRWTANPGVHPHERLVGLLALLHAASSHELRHAKVADIDHVARTLTLGTRPVPTPLDPTSWEALTCCLRHRATVGTHNPHLLVTKGTKAGTQPASIAYMSHVLDAVEVSIRALRTTRIHAMTHTVDAKLAATALGMSPEAVIAYLADHVDATRLPEEPVEPNPHAFGAT